MKRLKLAFSPYGHYLEEDDNFRRWVEVLERGLDYDGRELLPQDSVRKSPTKYKRPILTM